MYTVHIEEREYRVLVSPDPLVDDVGDRCCAAIDYVEEVIWLDPGVTERDEVIAFAVEQGREHITRGAS